MMQNSAAGFSPAEASVVETVIRRRRSIKPAGFSDQPVSRDVIRRLLEAANWAPTHGLTEPWRFTVFTEDSRNDLAAKLTEIYYQLTPPELVRPSKAEQLRQNMRLAPCVIAVAMHRQPSAKIPEIEEIEAVACAVQNLHLLATAMGLAGYWSSGSVICNELFGRWLGFEPPDRVLGLFYLGYPGVPWPEGSRSPVDNKIDWR